MIINEQTKSLIRHILTAVGLLVTALGLGEWMGLVDLFTGNLDSIFGAIEVIGGFVLAVIGFFRDRTRHEERVEGQAAIATGNTIAARAAAAK